MLHILILDSHPTMEILAGIHNKIVTTSSIKTNAGSSVSKVSSSIAQDYATALEV